MAGGNLRRSDFDRSENCYLVGGNELLMGEGGGQKFGEGESTGGIFPGGGEGVSKFLAIGGDAPPPPPPPTSQKFSYSLPHSPQ